MAGRGVSVDLLSHAFRDLTVTDAKQPEATLRRNLPVVCSQLIMQFTTLHCTLRVWTRVSRSWHTLVFSKSAAASPTMMVKERQLLRLAQRGDAGSVAFAATARQFGATACKRLLIRSNLHVAGEAAGARGFLNVSGRDGSLWRSPWFSRLEVVERLSWRDLSALAQSESARGIRELSVVGPPRRVLHKPVPVVESSSWRRFTSLRAFSISGTCCVHVRQLADMPGTLTSLALALVDKDESKEGADATSILAEWSKRMSLLRNLEHLTLFDYPCASAEPIRPLLQHLTSFAAHGRWANDGALVLASLKEWNTQLRLLHLRDNAIKPAWMRSLSALRDVSLPIGEATTRALEACNFEGPAIRNLRLWSHSNLLTPFFVPNRHYLANSIRHLSLEWKSTKQNYVPGTRTRFAVLDWLAPIAGILETLELKCPLVQLFADPRREAEEDDEGVADDGDARSSSLSVAKENDAGELGPPRTCGALASGSVSASHSDSASVSALASVSASASPYASLSSSSLLRDSRLPPRGTMAASEGPKSGSAPEFASMHSFKIEITDTVQQSPENGDNIEPFVARWDIDRALDGAADPRYQHESWNMDSWLSHMPGLRSLEIIAQCHIYHVKTAHLLRLRQLRLQVPLRLPLLHQVSACPSLECTMVWADVRVHLQHVPLLRERDAAGLVIWL